MPPQPPNGLPRGLGARNLTLDQLRAEDLVSIIDSGPTKAQTTLEILKEFFAEQGSVFSVENMAALAALDTRPLVVVVEGFYEVGDQGGGTFVWKEEDDSTPVVGMIVTPTGSPTGRFVRIYETLLNVKWFGAKGDNSTNDTAAFQAALDFPITLGVGDYGGATLYVPSGRYKIEAISTAVQTLTLVGDGVLSPRIRAWGAAQEFLITFTNASAQIDVSNIEFLGWPTTVELSDYTVLGLVFEGGTNAVHDCSFSRIRGQLWMKRGNYNRVYRARFGLFDDFGIKLGGVPDDAISETRITECPIYSGANDILGVDDSYLGSGIFLGTHCEATIIENVDFGSCVIGVEIVDNLNLGNTTAPGFVTARGVTTGNCGEAGIWIKNNGASFAADDCNFSAPGATSGDGLRVDSPNAAPRLYGCDFHRVQRNGIRVTDAWSVTVLSSTFRDIGIGGGDAVPGIGIHMVTGSAKVYVYDCIFDPDLQVDVSADMNYAVRLATAYTGTTHVFGCKATGMLAADWSNGSDTGVLITYDNSDYAVAPAGANAGAIQTLIDNADHILFPHPLDIGGSGLTVPPEKTLISLVSGEPVVTSSAPIIFTVGGGGDERTTHGPTFQGEWWVDGVDRTQLGVGFYVMPETYKLQFDTLFLTNLGTGMTGHRGNIRGVFIDRLFMYDLRDYGIRFYSDTRAAEIDTICIGPMLSNTVDSGAECVWFDIGPRVGSGGKNSFNIGAGIAYRGKNTIHTWGVIELTAQSWAGTGGGRVTFATEYKHGLAPGDVFYIDGSVPTGYNTPLGSRLTAQTWSGGTATFTFTSAPGFVAGDTFRVRDSLPDAYNATYTALTVVGNVVTATLASDPGASTFLGIGEACYLCLSGTTGKTLIAKLVTDPGASTTLGYYTVSSDVTYSGDIIFNAPRKLRVDKLSSRGTVDDGFNLQAGADFEFASVTIDDPGTSNFNIALTAQTFGCLSSVLTAQTWAAGVVTFTTTNSHGLNPGDPFTVSGSTPSGYNGNWVAVAASGTTLTAALVTDPGASTVLGSVTGITGTLTAQSWAASVLTFTTTAPHGLVSGDTFEITNSLPSGYNGVYVATAGTTGSTLKAALVSDPGASTSLGFLRGRNTFTTATVHGLSVGSYFVVQASSPDGYNGTYQAITVPSTTQVTGLRTFNPGASVTLGNLDVPLNVNAAGYHFGPKFHGSYRIRGGILHETYGPGVKDEAIYAMPSTIDGLLVWNSSWGSPGVNSGLYFAAGCSNRTLISVTSGTGDHWRHASRDITFAVGNVADGNTLTLNGTTITFRVAAALPFEVTIGATAAITVANLAAFIVASVNVNMLAVTPSVSTSGTSTVLTLTHYPGARGNLYTLARVGANITVGAPRLGGGTGPAVQKYGIEGLADGLRGNRIINANLWNNVSGEQSATNQPVPPSQGGTGVANNDLSTMTISGAFGLTWTVAAATSLTLPATGTLATLAGAETFTNKSITSPAITGTVTGGATYNSPTLVTPVLGVASVTTINKTAITAPATLATLAIADGKTLSFTESTYTPTITFASPGDLGVVYTLQTGKYWQVGSLVAVEFNLTFTPTFTTSTGAFNIAVPVAIGSLIAVGAVVVGSPTWPATRTQVNLRGASGASVLILQASGTGVAPAQFTVTEIASGVQYSINGIVFYSG